MRLLPLLLLPCLLGAAETGGSETTRIQRILKQIDATGSRIVHAYWDMLDTEGDPALTYASIDSLLRADTLVDSARFGVGEVIVYGVYDSASGGVERIGWLRSPVPPSTHRDSPGGSSTDVLVLGLAAVCGLALLAVLDLGWHRKDRT